MSDRTGRNDIFTSHPMEQGIQVRNVMKDDFGWEVPVECVPIPSEGLVYPQDSTLHLKKTVDIKAMTAKEEDILMSRALIQKGEAINKLIQSCLIDKSVDVNNMLVGDRNALMVSVRITGYGTGYRATVECPECNESNKDTFDLSQLEIKRLDVQPVVPGENVFEYKLPITKKTVRFKFMTGADERKRNLAEERRKKMFPGASDAEVTSVLDTLILSIEGITDRNKIKSFISNMPALDSKRLRAYIEKHEPGIDMSTWLTCQSCGADSKVGLPVNTEFFWPRE